MELDKKWKLGCGLCNFWFNR